MADNSVPIPADVAASFQRLQAAANELNNVSNQLGICISTLDSALQQLNLGISTWVRIDLWDNGHGDFEEHEIGYAKVGSKWGIVLRHTEGNFETDPDSNRFEQWLFNDAPRALRVQAVDHLAALLEKLIEEAKSTADRIEAKIQNAREVVAAVQGSQRQPTPQKAALQSMLTEREMADGQRRALDGSAKASSAERTPQQAALQSKLDEMAAAQRIALGGSPKQRK